MGILSIPFQIRCLIRLGKTESIRIVLEIIA